MSDEPRAYQPRPLRIWIDGARVDVYDGRNDTADCQDCQERYEKCLSDSAWWRQKAADYQAALLGSYAERDALRVRLRGDCQGDEPCAGELAYQAERKRARKWKRRARKWLRRVQEGNYDYETMTLERNEARYALAAMTERARGMRGALLRAGNHFYNEAETTFGHETDAAAGEPIP